MADTISQQVEKIFHKVFNRDDFSISESTSAKDIKGWDSLTHIHLIVSLEKEMGIKFKNSEITSFKTVGELLSSIEKKLAAKQKP